MKSLFLLITLLLTFNSLGQTVCHTPARSINSEFNHLMQSSALSEATNNAYCLKIYMHVIRKTDGTDGQPYDAVTTAYNILLSDFNPHNINFVWDGSVDYIDDNTLFNSPGIAVFSVNNHSDGIDIYLFDDSSPFEGGLANGVGESSEFFVSGQDPSPPNGSIVRSSVVSHEMAHVLFLWHTHHGTFNESGTDLSQCPELVDGSNAVTCGDYVEDTPADPNQQYSVDNATCQWLSLGNDTNGDPYDPDETNLMGYSTLDCMETFSIGQGERMRNAIETLPHLQLATVNCDFGSDLDLSMKDRYDDDGSDAGYAWTWEFDASPDIWVRNQDDGFNEPIHESPEYQQSTPVYVYVRVRNRGGITSLGTEEMSLYWTKASSVNSWPQNWDGSDPTLGNIISTESIPILEPGETAVIKFTWTIAANTGIGTEWNNCLLARVENSALDPITVHPGDLALDIYNNNNVSARNCVVTNYEFGFGPGGVAVEREKYFYVGNPESTATSHDLIFRNSEQYMGGLITDVAEVNVTLDEEGWEIILPYLQDRADIQIKENNTFSVTSNDPVEINGIEFPADTRVKVKVVFNFLTDEVNDQQKYEYHVIQKKSLPHPILVDHWTGGVHFLIIGNNERELFNVEAGPDELIDEGEDITLSAEDIGEDAVYNWYDSEGNLIYTGIDLTVSPEITKKYKLEIIADSDSYKDYDEVTVNVLNSKINSFSPNPVQNLVTVDYKVYENATSAYLMLVGTFNSGANNNYILDLAANSYVIDFSSFVDGAYSIVLVVDGEVVDSKPILKN